MLMLCKQCGKSKLIAFSQHDGSQYWWCEGCVPKYRIVVTDIETTVKGIRVWCCFELYTHGNSYKELLENAIIKEVMEGIPTVNYSLSSLRDGIRTLFEELIKINM